MLFLRGSEAADVYEIAYEMFALWFQFETILNKMAYQ